MPPKITKVRWDADDVPWGVVFDEQTGTFTGKPEEVGEYVIPVKVETNYGTDKKDVTILVDPPAYRVYSIGQNAETWSEGASPNSNGFRELGMPQAYELVSHYGGFGALTPGRRYYCCGAYDVGYRDTYFTYASKPFCVTDYDAARGYPYVDKVICSACYVYWSNYGTVSRQDYTCNGLWTFHWSRKRQAGTIFSGLVRVTQFLKDRSQQKTYNYSYDGKTRLISTVASAGSSNKLLLGEEGDISPSAYVRVLYGTNGNMVKNVAGVRKWLTNRGNVRVEDVGEKTQSLGYTAKKIFQPRGANGGLFQGMSSSMLLDNEAKNFTLGQIKDAWQYGIKVYVATTSGQLYENEGSTLSTLTWSISGTYDVKKMELPSPNMAFMLTEDGELYHKGSAVSEVTDEHEAFTRIFPELTYKDFTYGGNTLTVLME